MNSNDTMRIRVEIPSHSQEVTLNVKTDLHPKKFFEVIFDEIVRKNIIGEEYRRHFKRLNYYTDINNIITAKEIIKDGYSIEENITINSLGIRDIKNFTIVIATTKNESGEEEEQEGGCGSTSLLDLSGKETEEGKLVSFGPDWRVVDLGFNLEGICDNKDCEAYSQKVINIANDGKGSKGYGKFNLIIYLNQEQFLCPICKEYIFAITNFYFRNCAFEWTGVSRNSKGDRETLSKKGTAPKNIDVLTFKFQGDLEKEKKNFNKYDFNITKLVS